MDREESISNIADYLAINAKKMPDRTALLMPKRRFSIGKTCWIKKTFQELHEEVEELMGIFNERFHISPQHRVLLVIRPGYELITSVFALMRLGAIPIVIDSGMSLRQFFACARKSTPDFLLGTGALRWRFALLKPFFMPELRTIWLTYSSYRSKKHTHLLNISSHKISPPTPQADDPAAILFTSGSTGTAKGVLYRHRHFTAQLKALKDNYPLQEGGVDISLLPIFSLFNPILGRTTVLPEMNAMKPSQLQAKKIIKAIQTHHVTSSFGAPVLWRKIALYCRQQSIQLPDIRFLFLAGVSCDIPTLELLRSIIPNADIHTPYGATEALPIADIRCDEILFKWKIFQENGVGTCVGKPVTDTKIRIIKPIEGTISSWNPSWELSTGYIGEIIVSGPMVTETYDHEIEKTRMAKIYDGAVVWHRTGDMGFLDQQGRLWFCGRKAECIAVDDTIFYPDCTEPFFLKHPHVARCALIGLHRKKQLVPAIVIQPKRGHYPLWSFSRYRFIKELRALAQRYEKTSLIQNFFFCRKLPVDVRHNAKIHRLALGQKYGRRTLLNF
ncbi:MAG: AMP-binding protein [Puniceicoccales bacterium]|jgi:acyl-CoA synthetase (AMP-forming)/AMP-acid ligase II|nr:AMP-binding protein [Puniceicoccales bacterium]